MAKLTLVSDIVNDRFTEFIYDNYDIQNRERTITEVPLPSKADMDEMLSSDWNIMLIVGKSGSGKSTILNNIGIGKLVKPSYDPTKCVISQFESLGELEACDLLSSMGLSSVPTWLRKPYELSNGEKARLDIAKMIYESKGGVVLIDEFTSVVNRSAAKSMSFALQRYARKNGIKLVIASCHFDVVEWLRPDYIFNLEHKDKDGEAEFVKVVYDDDLEYVANQSVRDEDALSKAFEIDV